MDSDAEYINFLSLQDMIKYICEDTERYQRYSSFISKLVNAFNKLMDAINKSDCQDICREFDRFLFNMEKYFFTEIFESSNEHNESIDRVTNMLW